MIHQPTGIMLNSALHFQITQLRKTTIIYQFVVGNKALEDCFLRIVIKIVVSPMAQQVKNLPAMQETQGMWV